MRRQEEGSNCGGPRLSWYRKMLDRLVNYKGEWVDDHRGSLMTMATLIATITFQSAVSPPGGIWQETTTELHKGCNTTKCLAGTAVLASSAYTSLFLKFMVFNALSFMGSLAVLFLLVSGFPPKNRVCLWILTVAVCVTISFLGFTFLMAMELVLPDETIRRLKTVTHASKSSWIGLVAVLAAVNAIILLTRLIKYLANRYRSNRKGNHTVVP